MSMTAYDLISMALKELKVIAAGTEPDASELQDGMTHLKAMLRSVQTKGNEWRDTTKTVLFPALQSQVTLPSDVRTVTAVRAVDLSNERSMTLWDRDDYRAIPNKGTVGRPIAATTVRDANSVSLIVWPVPIADMTIAYDYQRKFVMITNPSGTVDLPEDWEEAVWTNLAVRMAGMFGTAAELTPELASRAASLWQSMLDDDRPDSYYMGTDRYA